MWIEQQFYKSRILTTLAEAGIVYVCYDRVVPLEGGSYLRFSHLSALEELVKANVVRCCYVSQETTSGYRFYAFKSKEAVKLDQDLSGHFLNALPELKRIKPQSLRITLL